LKGSMSQMATAVRDELRCRGKRQTNDLAKSCLSRKSQIIFEPLKNAITPLRNCAIIFGQHLCISRKVGVRRIEVNERCP